MAEKSQTGNLWQELCQLYRLLSPGRRRQLHWLLMLMLATAASEMLSLGVALPFLSALSDANELLTRPGWQPIWQQLGVTDSRHLVVVSALAFGLGMLVCNGLRLLSIRIQYWYSAVLTTDVSCEVYRRTLYQPYSFHLRHSSNDLIAALTTDIACFYGIVGSVLSLAVSAAIAVAVTISVVTVNPAIALWSGAVMGTFYTLLLRYSRSALARNGHIQSVQSRKMIRSLQEGIGSIRDVILDGSQDFFEQSYRQADHDSRVAGAQNTFIALSPKFLTETVAMVAIAVLTVVMVYREENLNQMLPMIGVLALAANRLLPALQNCFGSLANIRGFQASLQRILNALQRPIVPSSLVGASPAPMYSDLRFERVWFRYGEGHPWVLQDLSFKIKAKTTVAFVGSTGSGKSTTSDLILGLLQPDRGEVLVDGEPLRGERLRSWQRTIAHVPQHIFLSDATVAENIAFGTPMEAIDLERVRRAAQLAQIADFIESRQDGYYSVVGERGISLSGGQRQRIGIARALYKQASVMILDEATSALDNATEREVMAAIEGLSGELTIILIAHRLTTVERCDQVIELHQGQVAAQGSYGELLSQSASFRAMVGTI
ncbi:MAG: ABC transporter ATP-binding protein [Nodosilinea sp.]